MNVLKTRAQEVANDTQFDWFFNPFYQDENLKFLDMEHLSLDKIDIKKVFKFIYFYSAANISHEYEKISKLFDIRNSQCVCPFYEAKIGKATYNQSEYQHEPIINKVVIFYTEINNYESLEFCVEFLRCSYGLSNPIFIKPEYVENCQANEIKAFFTVPTAKFDKNENVIMPLIPTDFFLSQTSHYLNTQKNAD